MTRTLTSLCLQTSSEACHPKNNHVLYIRSPKRFFVIHQLWVGAMAKLGSGKKGVLPMLGSDSKKSCYLAAFFHAALSVWGLFPAAALDPAQPSQRLHLHQSEQGSQLVGDRGQHTSSPAGSGDHDSIQKRSVMVWDSNQNMVCDGMAQQPKIWFPGRRERATDRQTDRRRQRQRQTHTRTNTHLHPHRCYSRQGSRTKVKAWPVATGERSRATAA